MVERYDILGTLPIESSQKILMRISPEDLCNVSKCCKRWKNIARGSYFWKNKSELDYNFAGSEYVQSECYRKYVQNFSNIWQGHYAYNCELDYNWRNNICKKICVDFLLDLQSLVYMDDDVLIVSKTHEICIINISNGSIEKRFQAERLISAAVEKNEGLLIGLCCTANEGNIASLIIKVWDLKTNEAVVNFEDQIPVGFLRFCVYKHLLAFITFRDLELYVFNIKTGSVDYQRRHIRSVCFGTDTIAIATGLTSIEIMDLNFNVLKELTCCDDKSIQKMQVKNNYLVVASIRLDPFPGMPRVRQFICLWDLTTNVKLLTIEDGQYVDLTFINENKIICLNRRFAEKWWVCLSLPHFVPQGIGQKTIERFLYTSNNRFLFIDIGETSLKMWCPRTQKLIRSFDLAGRNVICQFGQLDILKVSNKNLAYVEKVDGNLIVHIVDFGPDINNKRTFI